MHGNSPIRFVNGFSENVFLATIYGFIQGIANSMSVSFFNLFFYLLLAEI